MLLFPHVPFCNFQVIILFSSIHNCKMVSCNTALVFLVALIVPALAFFPNHRNRYVRPDDTTHEDLIRGSIMQVVAKIFEDSPRPGYPLKAGQLQNMANATAEQFWKLHYGPGVSSHLHESAVQEVVTGASQAGIDHAGQATWSFNGEKIKEGHQLLINLEKVLLGMLNTTSPDYASARIKLAEYLSVLQNFYSSTNWVEMYGPKVYKDLGVEGAKLHAVAPPSLDTCNSCPTNMDDKQPYGCDGNLAVNSLLTSGYRSGQDAVKPTPPQGTKTGKCSHGGLQDQSRFTPATGGINKDTKNPFMSPLWYYHKDAAKGAMTHTQQFLHGTDGNGGLKKEIGVDKLRQLLNIIDPSEITTPVPPTLPPYSIGFVIDTTGSMGNDIAAVRTLVTQQLLKLKGSQKQPTNYVLSTFNDPGSAGFVKTTTNPDELLRWVNGLRANGGGDCPEYAMSGLQRALQNMIASPLSQVFVFTDAPAKDESMANNVLNIAKAKGIRINFLLTPGCDRRKKRFAGRKYQKP